MSKILNTLDVFATAEPSLPPQLPPRNFSPNDVKENESSEQPCKSLTDTYLSRLHYMDLSTYVRFSKDFFDSQSTINLILTILQCDNSHKY